MKSEILKTLSLWVSTGPTDSHAHSLQAAVAIYDIIFQPMSPGELTLGLANGWSLLSTVLPGRCFPLCQLPLPWAAGLQARGEGAPK